MRMIEAVTDLYHVRRYSRGGLILVAAAQSAAEYYNISNYPIIDKVHSSLSY